MALALTPAAAWAGVVTTDVDGIGPGTLRSEIASTNPGGTITFNPGVNPTLTMGQIMVTKDLTIAGNGIGETTITGPSADRVFQVTLGNPEQTLTIHDLTITGGHAPAGAGPGFVGESGGGILLQTGGLTVDGVEFADNIAGTGGDGGTGSSGGFGTGGTGGSGSGGGFGGGIAAGGGSLIVRNSIFHDNFAGAGGTGGTGGTGMSGGGTGGMGGVGGPGGAIATATNAEISNTTFSNNHAGRGGNGGAGGGSSFGSGPGGTAGGGGRGGAISQLAIPPEMPLTGSTFNGNEGGQGGTGGDATFSPGAGGTGGSGGALSVVFTQVTNSTLTANQGGQGGPGGVSPFGLGTGGDGGNGGAVDGIINIHASTIAGNRTGLGGAGGTTGGTGVGGGVNNSSPSGTMVGSIVANNMLGGGPTTDFLANCAGAVPSTNSNNLTFPADTGCVATVGNPLLGPLANNGGATQTLALGPGSAAIDQLPVGSNCPAADQRGIARPQGPACDIGAFELVPTPPASPANAPASKAKKCKKKHKKHAKKKKSCKKKRKKHKK